MKARIRFDLQEQGLSVPIGSGRFHQYIDTKEWLPYRWLNEDTDDEVFQVMYNDLWEVANSIDFEFDNMDKNSQILDVLVHRFKFCIGTAQDLMEEHSDIVEVNFDATAEEIAGDINEAYEQGY